VAQIAPTLTPPSAHPEKGEPRAGAPRRPGRLARSFRQYWQLYLLVIPPVAYFVIFQYVPMANAVIAFKNYNVVEGIWGSPWAGFTHFERFFDNPMFTTVVKNTFLLSLYALIAGFPIPIILALALNEIRARFFKKTVIVSMAMLLLSPRVGIIGDLTGFFGVPAADYMAKPDFFRHIYVWTEIWQTTGYSAVIFLAALAGVDPSLYEAARMDGASRLQKIWHVDLPSILPTIVVVLILSVGSIMAVGFEKAFLLQNPLNLSQSEIIATYTYKVGLQNADFSLSTAIGLFNSVINLVLLVGVNIIAKRVTGRGLW
jgi:putative aldouronate transport system permease protein